MKRQRVYQAQERNCPCSAGTLFRPHQAAIIVGHWARVPSDQTELCSFISRILAHLLFSYFPFPCQPFSPNLWKVTLWRPPRLHTWILKFPEIFSIDQRMKYLHANAWYFVHVQFGASSRAKHGGAYFSAVYGSIEDRMAAPGPYENLEPPFLGGVI